MRRPLSANSYIDTHKKQVSTIVITIALAFSVVSLLQLFLDTLQQFYRKSYLSPNEQFSMVYQQYDKPITFPPELNGISPIPATEDRFPIYSVLGKVNARVWNVPPENTIDIVE